MTAKPSWQSTVIAVVLILLVGGIFIVVYEKNGIDDALKAWAAVGTLVGIITGAVPTYFFGQQQAAAAEQTAQQARQDADEEKRKRDEAEAKAALVLGFAPKEAIEQAQEVRPELFNGR